MNLNNIKINKDLEKAVKSAKEANQSKTRFLASASHDLRQPINTISLFVATLSLKQLDDEDAEIVKHMSSAVNTMDTQLNALLEMSKLDSGIIQPQISTINLTPILDDIASICKKQHQSNTLDIKYISPQKRILLNTDQVLLERIISNIISNAIKYTPKGLVEISILNTDQEFIVISIVDTGIGISKEGLVKIYDEFYQEGNEARDPSLGFGLGLSIVKRLCDLLDIEIIIGSEKNVGTNVRLKMRQIET